MLFVVRLDQSLLGHIPQWVQKVQPTEREKIVRYVKPIDQLRSLVGQLLIQMFMVKTYGRVLEIKRDEHNRPFATGCIDFNISHHSDFVCFISAHHSGKVGIDVIDVDDRPLEHFNSIFTVNELEWIQGGVDGLDINTRFSVLWSLKEAYCKYKGFGIVVDLLEMEFVLTKGGNGYFQCTVFDNPMQIQLLLRGKKEKLYFRTERVDECIMSICVDVCKEYQLQYVTLKDLVHS